MIDLKKLTLDEANKIADLGGRIGDIADITEQGVIVYHDGKVVERQPIHIDWDKEAAPWRREW